MKIWVMTSRNLFICFFVAGFILQACREKPSAVSEEAPLITVAYPQQRSVTLYKEYPGYISAWNAVDVVARVSGYLRESRPEAGTLVKQGELLYVIEPTLYENAVKQAEAGVLNARATLDYARNNYTRMKEARSSNAVSEIDLIQARSNMQIAEAALANAEAALNTAQTNLSYCYVRSPYTGHISLTAYAVGGYISGATSPARLSTVYQDSAVYAYFSIEDAQYLTIVENLRKMKPSAADRKVEVYTRENSAPYSGAVGYLSPNINLSTGTITLRASIENPRGELKDGLYVTVRIKSAYKENALLVPSLSVGTDQLGKYLYVVGADNKVNYRHIETSGTVEDTLTIVESGLQPGERYVSKALLKVRDGMIVNPRLEP